MYNKMRQINKFCLCLKLFLFICAFAVLARYTPIQSNTNPKPNAYIFLWSNFPGPLDSPWKQAIYSCKKILQECYGYNIIINIQNFYPTYFTKNDFVLSFIPLPSTNELLQNIPHINHLKKYIFLQESPITSGSPLMAEKDGYNRIFTYTRSETDNRKIKQVMLPYSFWKKIEVKPKNVLLAEIATLYLWGDYKVRQDIAIWFLENHPDDFKLYGSYWETIQDELSPKGLKAFSKQYHGWVPDKMAVIEHAKFVFACENIAHEGYISEKIFDAMQAGSVPVYFGAPDIEQYVPANCFINFNQFSSYEELYNYLKNMPDEQYETYLKNIRHFVSRFDKTPFYPKTVTQQLMNGIFSNKPLYLIRTGQKWDYLKPIGHNQYCFLENPKKCGTLTQLNSQQIQIRYNLFHTKIYTRNQWGNFEPMTNHSSFSDDVSFFKQSFFIILDKILSSNNFTFLFPS